MMRVRVLTVTSTEPIALDRLSLRELGQLAELRGAHRRTEWRRARRALRTALALTGLDADTAQYRMPHPRISLTHTADHAVAAVVLDPMPDRLVGVGVDAESRRPVDARTAGYFLTPRERAQLDGPDEQLRLWTAKEALFKSDPGNADTTLMSYRIDAPAARSSTARRHGADGIRFCHTTNPVPHGGHLTVAVALALGPLFSRSSHPMTTITFDAVAERAYELLSVPPGSLTPDTKVRDLVADSFALVEMVIDVQEEFDVILTHTEVSTIATFGDLVSLLQAAQEVGA